MNDETPRLRMFAGPNGSGKSTFKSIIRPELLGVFINPDEIEQEIQNYDFLDLKRYRVNTTEKEILDYFYNSTHEHIWLAEITDGHLLEMKTDRVPAWFKKALGSKFNIEHS